MSVYFEKLFRLNETRVGYIVRSIATTKFAERKRDGTIMRRNFFTFAITLKFTKIYLSYLFSIYIKQIFHLDLTNEKLWKIENY